MNPLVRRFWDSFRAVDSSIPKDTPFQVWYFGNTQEMARELAELVLSGKKFATASLAAVNEIKPDEAPIADGYSVVTDLAGAPMCVIQQRRSGICRSMMLIRNLHQMKARVIRRWNIGVMSTGSISRRRQPSSRSILTKHHSFAASVLSSCILK